MADENIDLFLPKTMRANLWDNQRFIVNCLQDGFVNHDRKGMLCCEKMGAGKTLAALATTIGLSDNADYAKTDLRLKLVVCPTSAIESWKKDCDTQFYPSLRTLVVGGSSTENYTINYLKKDIVVIVNLSAFVQSYKKALTKRTQATKSFLSLMTSSNRPSDNRITWVRTYLQYLSTTFSLWVPEDADYSQFVVDNIIDKENSLTNSHSILLDDNLFSIEWEWLIVDEVHEARNPNGKRFSALQSALTHRRLALTATPYNNRISDFMSILSILHEAPSDGWEASFDRGWNVDQLLEFLNQQKNNVMVVSDYENVKKMYAKFNTLRVSISVPFSTEEEQQKYQQMHEYYQHRKNGERTVIFQAISELRKLCDGPTKISIAEKYTRELLIPYQEKAVFFVWHVSLCQQMTTQLKQVNKRLLVEQITGAVSPSCRLKSLERLERCRGAAVLVTTIQSMALGVNMPFLHHAVVFTTWWNSMNSLQAKDRIRRPQQKRSPRIVDVVIEGTVERGIDLVSFFKSKFNHQLVYEEITRKMLIPITLRKAMERRLDEMTNGTSNLKDLQMSEKQIIKDVSGITKKNKTREKKEKGDAVFQQMVFNSENDQRGLLEMIDFFFSSTEQETKDVDLKQKIWEERCDVLIEDVNGISFKDKIPPTTLLKNTEPSTSSIEKNNYCNNLIRHKEEVERKRKRTEAEAMFSERKKSEEEARDLNSKRQMLIKERCDKYNTTTSVESHYSSLSDIQRAAIFNRSVSGSRKTIHLSKLK